MEKFLFDNCFENADAKQPASAPEPAEEPTEQEEPPPPPPPTYSEGELNAARQESFLAGKQDGLQEALNSTEVAATRVLESMSDQLDKIFSQWEDVRQQDKELALQVATSVTRKLFPRLAVTSGFQEIEQVVCDCLDRLPKEPRLVIRMADGQLDSVRGRIEKIAERSGYEGRLVFLEEPNLGPSDVRVEWADGGAERDCDALWASIDEILKRSLTFGAQSKVSNERHDAKPAGGAEKTPAVKDAIETTLANGQSVQCS